MAPAPVLTKRVILAYYRDAILIAKEMQVRLAGPSLREVTLELGHRGHGAEELAEAVAVPDATGVIWVSVLEPLMFSPTSSAASKDFTP